jgi:hypothetical protein
MRRKYFDLLVAKAEKDDGSNSDLLNRIERLIGVAMPAPSDQQEDGGQTPAGSKPAASASAAAGD